MAKGKCKREKNIKYLEDEHDFMLEVSAFAASLRSPAAFSNMMFESIRMIVFQMIVSSCFLVQLRYSRVFASK